MKIKTIISTILLLFVAASATYLVIDEVRSNSQQNSKAIEAHFSSMDEGVIVYYFYGNVRCVTCRKFESYTQELLQNTFAEEMEKGNLIWKMVNTDEPGNKHFMSDYELYTKSIVLVKISGGKQVKWKNLDKIWERVGD
ncbi:MAG: nitrophenyl compound nitroreductase subunit ArsF family protein, partial [Phycisphaerales bacterium]